MSKLIILIIPLLIAGVYWSNESAPEIRVIPEATTTPAEEKPAATVGRTMSLRPSTVIQGEPALVEFHGLTSISSIKSLTFDGKPLRIFMYEGRPAAFIGIDLRMNTGSYKVRAELSTGQIREEILVVNKRVAPKVAFGIPKKLGGNTPAGEKKVVTTLVSDSAQIARLTKDDKKLWTEKFGWPLDPPVVVTDVYGYSRETGTSVISHKGTDLRAATGTPVYAMNDGMVRFSKFLETYGNTVVLDHGVGLQTIYMHLESINVKVGESVVRRQEIGKSGDTGYVLGPHLHLTVRIWGISVDPMKFMELFGLPLT